MVRWDRGTKQATKKMTSSQSDGSQKRAKRKVLLQINHRTIRVLASDSVDREPRGQRASSRQERRNPRSIQDDFKREEYIRDWFSQIFPFRFVVQFRYVPRLVKSTHSDGTA